VNLQLRPTLLGLLREGAGPWLVAAQVALALAVLVNAVYVAKQRIDKIAHETGIDVEQVFAIRSAGFTSRYQHVATIRADLEYLRSVPDVEAASVMDYAPLVGRGNRTRFMLKQGDMAHAVRAAIHTVDEHALDVLGVKLVAGRNFLPQDILPPKVGDAADTAVSQVLISRVLADALFPDGQAVGKGVYAAGPFLSSPAIVTGVIENLDGHTMNRDNQQHVAFLPRLPYPEEPAATYAVRVRPGRMAQVMSTVEKHFEAPDPDRFIEWIHPLQYFKDRASIADRNMTTFLIVVTVLLLTITAFGVFGLATFNVGTRTKQIGTRRAVGARRADIIGQYIVENWLITTAGVIVGCALALGAGSWLSSEYQLPQLDLYYLVAGIPALWIIGLLAAWYPARRAAAISPATATRAV
jgi:putative ABC transport system permease protein